MARARTQAIARAQRAYALRAATSLPDCGHGFVTLISKDFDTVSILPLRCHKWSCPHCAPLRLLQLQAKARRGHPERHIVLTLRPNMFSHLPDYLTYLRSNFRKLTKLIRREFHAFEYISILELQHNGTPHLHLLTRGTYIPWRWLTATWKALTGSWHVHISAITRSQPAIDELTKYTAKTAATLSEVNLKHYLVSCSHGYILDPPDSDPSYSERHYYVDWHPISLHHLTSVLSLYACELVKSASPGIGWTISKRAPPTPKENHAVRRQIKDSHVDAYYLCMNLLAGPAHLADYCESRIADRRDDWQVTSPSPQGA